MGKALEDFALQMGQSVFGAGMGMLLGKYQDKRQREMNQFNSNLQEGANRRLMNESFENQYDLWNKTSYPGQMKKLKEAGLNPALMYGMGGGGGTTTGGGGASVGMGAAPSTGGEATQMAITAANLGLLKAQKENIEADTANKQADIPVKEAQQRDITASAEGKGLLNAFTAWMQGKDIEGNEVGENMSQSAAAQAIIQNIKESSVNQQFRIDENERQKLMNSKVLQELSAKIALLDKQGLSQDQITENLKKEGLLKDAEIEWNKLDISKGNFGKFISNFLRMLVRPR